MRVSVVFEVSDRSLLDSAYFFQIWSGDMADNEPNNAPGRPPEIVEIAKWVLGIAGIAIFGLSVVSLIGAMRVGPEQFDAASQRIFSSLLPLLGTWVGTVLAYYFSSKNFETASQSVERMVTL